MGNTLDIQNGEVMEVEMAVVPYQMKPLSVESALALRTDFRRFVHEVLVEEVDYGPPYPGGDKNTLKQPGAQKLQTFFGLEVGEPILIDSVKDWQNEFFYFEWRVDVFREGRRVGFGVGSANSRETKWRYRWVKEHEIPPELEKASLKTRGGKLSEFAFAIKKGETTGKYGKPESYWQQFRDAIASGTAKKISRKIRRGDEYDAWEITAVEYRVPNTDICDQVNTINKIAVKRAYVSAVAMATMASDYFDIDLEEGEGEPDEGRAEVLQEKKPASASRTASPGLSATPPPAPDTTSSTAPTQPAKSAGQPIKHNFIAMYKIAETEHGLGATATKAVWEQVFGLTGWKAHTDEELLACIGPWLEAEGDKEKQEAVKRQFAGSAT